MLPFVTPPSAAQERGSQHAVNQDHVVVAPPDLLLVLDGHGEFAERTICGPRFDALLARHLSNRKVGLARAVAVAENELRAESPVALLDCGCTLTGLRANQRSVSFVNIGDSRTVVADSNGDVVFVTRDHHPDDPAEAARVEAAGGFVLQDDVPRVNGSLAVSRAFGDWNLRPAVSGDAEVTKMRAVRGAGSYVVMMTDGMWLHDSGFAATWAVVREELLRTRPRTPEQLAETQAAVMRRVAPVGDDRTLLIASFPDVDLKLA